MPKASLLEQQEQAVESRSAELRKELGLADLTLTQVLFIVGLPWVGVAAKQGPAHVVLWLAAIAFFYLPSAAVVIHLNRAMPLEGGLYQWAKLGFNELDRVPGGVESVAVRDPEHVRDRAAAHPVPALHRRAGRRVADRAARGSSTAVNAVDADGARDRRRSAASASASGSTRRAAC